MSARIILAVDPGLMTGACRWIAGVGVEHGFELPHLQFLDWSWEALKAHGPETVVVIEQFTINANTAKKTPAPWSLEAIGALKWQAQHWGAQVEMQSASDAKTFVTNDRLRQADCWFKGLEHARDAGRHLLLYMARVGWYDGNSVKGPVHAG